VTYQSCVKANLPRIEGGRGESERAGRNARSKGDNKDDKTEVHGDESKDDAKEGRYTRDEERGEGEKCTWRKGEGVSHCR
jgi:hypothetical protein